jgi:DNA-binding transcriptional LysR family regulator
MAQVEEFLAVAEELHFGRAAERLHVSQPRVSRLIAALERQAGGRPFERTSRKVTLTRLGSSSMPSCGPAMSRCVPRSTTPAAALGRSPGCFVSDAWSQSPALR